MLCLFYMFQLAHWHLLASICHALLCCNQSMFKITDINKDGCMMMMKYIYFLLLYKNESKILMQLGHCCLLQHIFIPACHILYSAAICSHALHILFRHSKYSSGITSWDGLAQRLAPRASCRDAMYIRHKIRGDIWLSVGLNATWLGLGNDC